MIICKIKEIIYPKQFGFQKSYYADEAIVQLVSQIHEAFEQNRFTVGVFIDLWKAFETADDDLIWNKLKFVELLAIVCDFFFSILVLFHKYSWITGLLWKEKNISLTSHYHFHQLHKHLEVSQAITKFLQRGHLCI